MLAPGLGFENLQNSSLLYRCDDASAFRVLCEVLGDRGIRLAALWQNIHFCGLAEGTWWMMMGHLRNTENIVQCNKDTYFFSSWMHGLLHNRIKHAVTLAAPIASNSNQQCHLRLRNACLHLSNAHFFVWLSARKQNQRLEPLWEVQVPNANLSNPKQYNLI